ncbi:PilX N-terminal domain-containing pilus assembly protein [Halomonas sp. SSL-5]|uniref:PilX N-terminal domain-containing pilus assembly protein n=1 Tax=Halomonas sp. SSL-5 TaxID=3065855 RepID=UPI002739DA04|nr:PilX N-terminal domain-containing pilus assembly protein [Halomonas sp. SSL-5]MDY7117385.1 PilX N-terminal domain-containing pilus assembly protein [Halomonas sp. SSL-5]
MKYRHQGGVALVTSLLILVVALLLAISSMQNSRIEEGMAGNYRAATRAHMAAEYAASLIASSVRSLELELGGGTFEDLLSNASPDGIEIGGGRNLLDDISAYYRFESQGVAAGGGQVKLNLLAIGEVMSGTDVVARRDIVFEVGVDLNIDSPLSFMCPNSFDIPSNADAVVGEEDVDAEERYRPAIAAGERSSARFIVAEILDLKDRPEDPEDSYYSTDSIFSQDEVLVMNQDGSMLWDESTASDDDYPVYHAAGYVAVDGDSYEVNYDLTKQGCKDNGKGAGSNALCNFKGGVAAKYGAPALESAESFHKFISAIFSDGGDDVVFLDEGAEISEYQPGKINIVTSNTHHYLNARSGGSLEFAEGPYAFSSSPLSDQVLSDAVEENGVSYDVSVEVVGGETSGQFYKVANTDEELAASEYFLFKSSGRELSSPWYPDGEYFPSSQGYYDLVGDVVFSSSSGAMLLQSSSYYQYDGGDVVMDGDGNPIFVTPTYPDIPAGIDDGVARSSYNFSNGFGPAGNGQDPAVLLIDGDAHWGTNSSFNGIIIILGDSDMSGGGNGDVNGFNGSVFSVPYFFDHDEAGAGVFECQKSIYDASGGGNFQVRFDRADLEGAFNLLPPDAQIAWVVGSSISATPEGWKEKLEY